jgi:hypothetical protein
VAKITGNSFRRKRSSNMYNLKAIAALAACGVATVNAVAFQPRQYKTLVSSVCHPLQIVFYNFV